MAHTNHYDLHVTVADKTKVPADLLEDYKAVIYSFQDFHKKGPVQHILCARTTSNFLAANERLMSIVSEIEGMGGKVLRYKLEAAPSNDDFPFTGPHDVDTPIEQGRYLEGHISWCYAGLGDGYLDRVIEALEEDGAYASIGTEDPEEMIYLTIRGYPGSTMADFKERYNKTLDFLNSIDLPPVRHNIEYALIDTNIGIDKEWLPMPKTLVKKNRRVVLGVETESHQYIIQKLQESVAATPEELIDSTIVDRSVISPVKHLSDNTWHTTPDDTIFQSIDGHLTIAWDPDNGHRTLTTACKVKKATSKSKPSKVEKFSSATSRRLMSKIGL